MHGPQRNDLSRPEQRLWKACSRGELVDLHGELVAQRCRMDWMSLYGARIRDGLGLRL